MMKIFLGITLLLCTSVSHAWPDARQALDEFLKFELNGGRLSSWDFKKYLVVDKEFEEPGWDEIHLVQKHHVVEFTCKSEQCLGRVEVVFEPTRKYVGEQLVPHPKGGHALLRYHIVKSGKQWLLTHPGGQPLVSTAAYQHWKAKHP